MSLKNVIITELSGGLGNQLFQYSAGKSLAKKLGVPLILDLGNYKDSKRPYALDIFDINPRIATIEEIEQAKRGEIFRKIAHKISARLENPVSYILLLITGFYVFKEPYSHFYPDFFRLPKNSLLRGNWQSQKYFENIIDDLRNELVFRSDIKEKCLEMLSQISSINSVSIHVRREDYLDKPEKYPVCSIEYYKEAVKILEQKISEPVYFIFSDDTKWFKGNMGFIKNAIFISDKTYRDCDEFFLMSLCKHNIIANSSFSWWAAKLGKNRDKLVIAPKMWFGGHIKDTMDIVPSSWIKI